MDPVVQYKDFDYGEEVHDLGEVRGSVSRRRHMAIIWQTPQPQQPRHLYPPLGFVSHSRTKYISQEKVSTCTVMSLRIFHHPLEPWLKRGGYAEDAANNPPILCGAQYQTTPAVSRAADTIFAIAHTFSSSYFLATSCTPTGAPS